MIDRDVASRLINLKGYMIQGDDPYQSELRLILAELADEVENVRDGNRDYVKAVDKYLETFRARLDKMTYAHNRAVDDFIKAKGDLSDSIERLEADTAIAVKTFVQRIDRLDKLANGQPQIDIALRKRIERLEAREN